MPFVFFTASSTLPWSRNPLVASCPASTWACRVMLISWPRYVQLVDSMSFMMVVRAPLELLVSNDDLRFSCELTSSSHTKKTDELLITLTTFGLVNTLPWAGWGLWSCWLSISTFPTFHPSMLFIVLHCVAGSSSCPLVHSVVFFHPFLWKLPNSSG